MVTDNKQTDADEPTKRRRFLRTAGVVGVAGLAGCSGGNGSGGSGSSGNGSGGSGSSGNGSASGSSGGGNTIKIGAIYPLTGNLGAVGQNIQKTLNAVVNQVINKSTSDLGPLLFQKEEGLPNLDNRHVEILWADHRSDPGQGRSEAERLIQTEDVDALYGCYNSSVTKTVSAVCERKGVPMLTGESSSPSLTERGLNWFWRSGPHDKIYSQNMFQFFNGLNKRQNAGLESVAIIHEDTEYGSTSAKVQKKLANQHGYEIVAGPIAYTAESVTSFTSQLNRIQQADPDVLLPTSYVKDAILMAKDMQDMNYFPPIMMGQDSGHNEPSFVNKTGLSNYFCSRSTFSDDMTTTISEIGTYNQWLKDQTGVALNGVYIRSWGGLMTLLKGIDAAGSTDPSKIQSGLNNLKLEKYVTDLPFGVKFAENGQNKLATGVLNQYHDSSALAIFPFELAKDDSFTFPAPDWNSR